MIKISPKAALVDVPADSNFDGFADPSVSAASDSLSPEEILADVEVGRIFAPLTFFDTF